ncbi:hypothetical protein TcasGA2_TC013157 [Tribolium castaneum]|uniref:Uncharacterized protein n=1 Tax=Tribolium castaneum TaxID=7070 RepID=D6WNE9_TRICA|nr:hypothetical protein TcasGA2_TC013157 [Tribolium castaneum]
MVQGRNCSADVFDAGSDLWGDGRYVKSFNFAPMAETMNGGVITACFARKHLHNSAIMLATFTTHCLSGDKFFGSHCNLQQIKLITSYGNRRTKMCCGGRFFLICRDVERSETDTRH